MKPFAMAVPNSRWRAILLTLAGILAWSGTVVASPPPEPPCAPGEIAPVPDFGLPPNISTWTQGDLPAGWRPDSCIGWATRDFTLLIALSARFPFAGSADDLLTRFGALASWRGIQYWSVTDRRWQTLITDSSALAKTDASSRRADFTASELKEGGDFYFLQRDNRSSNAVVFRMRVGNVDAQGFILTIENVTAVRAFLLPVFAPGDLIATYVVRRIAPSLWGFYSLSGARGGGFLSGRLQPASHINRAAAVFRHIVGLPTDQEPPAAP
jgi:uncharacterized protein DUF6675